MMKNHYKMHFFVFFIKNIWSIQKFVVPLHAFFGACVWRAYVYEALRHSETKKQGIFKLIN